MPDGVEPGLQTGLLTVWLKGLFSLTYDSASYLRTLWCYTNAVIIIIIINLISTKYLGLLH